MLEQPVAVPASADERLIESRRLDPIPPLVALALTFGLFWLLPRPLGSDISGQLWIAHHIRAGARFYVDISEVNPPLWFWLAIPLDAVAELWRMPADDAVIGAFGGVTMLSLVATDRLLAHLPPRRRRAFLGYAALALLVMPARDLGQREQLALICALPYAALAANRRAGRPTGRLLAILTGVTGALGFALKHYFLGVPLLLELWLLAGLRRDWRPIRAETVALAVGGLCYLAAILAFAPAYLTVMVPELRLAYGTTGVPSARDLVQLAQVVWLVVLLAMAPQHRLLRSATAPFAIALLLCALGFGAAWLIQHKGWPYQGLATTGMLALAFAALLAEAWERLAGPVRLLAPTILLLPIALVLTPTHSSISASGDIAPALAGLRGGDAIAVVSTESLVAWPSTIGRGFRYASRYNQYWMLNAVDADAAADYHDPRLAAFARQVIRETVTDYRCLPPRRIVFVRPAISGPNAAASADPLAFFLRDAAFARLFAHYRRWRRYGIVDAYELVTPPPPLPAAACRRGI